MLTPACLVLTPLLHVYWGSGAQRRGRALAPPARVARGGPQARFDVVFFFVVLLPLRLRLAATRLA